MCNNFPGNGYNFTKMKLLFLLIMLSGSTQVPTLKYQWRKISGPNRYSILTPNAATTAVTDLEIGVYEFELKVTNRRGLSSKDTMKLTVKFQDPNNPQNSTAKVTLSPVPSRKN